MKKARLQQLLDNHKENERQVEKQFKENRMTKYQYSKVIKTLSIKIELLQYLIDSFDWKFENGKVDWTKKEK